MSRPAVVVTGASGLVGRALARAHPTVALPRGAGAWGWEPTKGVVHDDRRRIAAVVHLAGESVAGGRWSDARKARIRDSRVQGTRALVDWLVDRGQRPSVLVCASAVGFYGDRADQELPETAIRGRGFLSDLCVDWEAEARRAEQAGIRVVMARLGVVMSPDGGSLAKMLPAFKMGGGGPLGRGTQWFPWIHQDDLAQAVLHIIQTPSISGPVNLVAPGVVRQKQFAQTLGRVLGRPAVVPAPVLALRAAFGRGMADELLLSSQRAVPAVLLQTGFCFAHPELRPALGDLLSS